MAVNRPLAARYSEDAVPYLPCGLLGQLRQLRGSSPNCQRCSWFHQVCAEISAGYRHMSVPGNTGGDGAQRMSATAETASELLRTAWSFSGARPPSALPCSSMDSMMKQADLQCP